SDLRRRTRPGRSSARRGGAPSAACPSRAAAPPPRRPVRGAGSRFARQSPGKRNRDGKEGSRAGQASKRQEREAVREAEGEGNVEGARGEDRELAGRVEPRRQGVAFVVVAQQLLAGRDDRPEEGSRPQGRQGDSAQELGGLRKEQPWARP